MKQGNEPSGSQKDKIFLKNEWKGRFRFTSSVAEVFDDMLLRSVPCYSQVIEMTAGILGQYLVPGDKVFDLGCSTGTTLIELARSLAHLNLSFTGFDNSAAMIAKASLKARQFSYQDRLRFEKRDIMKLDLNNGGGAILNYTLQFINPEIREGFLKKVHGFLRPGGVLVMSEKVVVPDPVLNSGYIEFYHDFKRLMGYSETEIANKREALENVLIPLSAEENLTLIKKAGFKSAQPFFQWFNFVSFVGIKEM